MLIANARMYAVTPGAAAAWAHLLREVSERAGVPMSVLDYPAPLPLEDLWSRLDLGCAFMCGFPFASAGTRPVLLATPVPTRFGAPAYATDFVVRADAGFTTLEETFGHRLAWTVGHSHSGCNAPRHHLLRYSANSTRWWAVTPRHRGQWFHGMMGTDSTGSWAPC